MSAPMQLSNDLKNEDLFVFKTIQTIFEMSPRSLGWILMKATKKEPNDTWFDYLGGIMSNTRRKSKFANLDLLKQNDALNFDTTFIYALIKCSCKDLDDNKFLDSSCLSLEHYIQKIKNLRNELAHAKSHQDLVNILGDGKILKEAKTYFEEVIKLGGERYNVTQTDIDAELRSIQDWYDGLLTKSDEEIISDYCSTVLREHYSRVAKVNPIYFTHESFTGIKVTDIFVDLEVKESTDRNTDPIISSKNILSSFENKSNPPPMVLIIGPAGSGKSTLTRNIIAKWDGHQNDMKMDHINDYKLLLYIECRESSFPTFEDYVNWLLKNIFHETQVKSQNFIKWIRGQKTLILVDGVDEFNENSKKLVKEIMNLFGNTCSFLFTTRPEGVESLKVIVKDNFDLLSLTIRSMTYDQKKRIVDNYFPQMTQQSFSSAENKSSNDFLDIILTSSHDVQQIMNTPLNLILALYLYLSEEKFAVEKVSSLFSSLVALNEEKMLSRMYANEGLSDLKKKSKSNTIREVIQQEAFELLMKDKLYLNMNVVTKLMNQYESNGFSEENIQDIFSVYLNCKQRMRADGDQTYSFPHKGIQEYLAAEHLVKELIERIEIERSKKRIWFMRKSKRPLHDMLKLKKSDIAGKQKYRNLLILVAGLMTSNDKSEDLLFNYGEELVNLIFPESKNSIEQISIVLLECEYNKQMAKLMAEKVELSQWSITEDIDKTVKALLEYTSPNEVIYTNRSCYRTPDGTYNDEIVDLFINKKVHIQELVGKLTSKCIQRLPLDIWRLSLRITSKEEAESLAALELLPSPNVSVDERLEAECLRPLKGKVYQLELFYNEDKDTPQEDIIQRRVEQIGVLHYRDSETIKPELIYIYSEMLTLDSCKTLMRRLREEHILSRIILDCRKFEINGETEQTLKSIYNPRTEEDKQLCRNVFGDENIFGRPFSFIVVENNSDVIRISEKELSPDTKLKISIMNKRVAADQLQVLRRRVSDLSIILGSQLLRGQWKDYITTCIEHLYDRSNGEDHSGGLQEVSILQCTIEVDELMEVLRHLKRSNIWVVIRVLSHYIDKNEKTLEELNELYSPDEVNNPHCQHLRKNVWAFTNDKWTLIKCLRWG